MKEEPTSERFRLAMGRFATGVTVLTTVAGGHDHAKTANAVDSVSLESMLVLACVEVRARFHDAVARRPGLWCVSVLDAEQSATADWLATRGRPLHGQLDLVPHHRGATGVALLDGAVATIECRTRDLLPHR